MLTRRNTKITSIYLLRLDNHMVLGRQEVIRYLGFLGQMLVM